VGLFFCFNWWYGDIGIKNRIYKKMYKKILLKISGEALLDRDNSNIISALKLNFFISQIKEIYDKNIKIGLVIGGGNILRGENTKNLPITRYKADNMGMLSTVINGIAFEEALINNGMSAVLLSSLEINKVCEFYTTQKAIEYLNNNKIVIFAGGVANPYFSTDTGAILKALEIGADVVLKGTQVKGIYDKDPKKFDDAQMYNQISHDEFISKNLLVMDQTAVILAKKEKLPIVVFNIHQEGSLKNILLNNQIDSIIKT
jgi:uridylate kinase